MNRYILIHRLTGPAVLLLLGVVALLHQAGLVRYSIFVPLLLILVGVIKLAERAVLAQGPHQVSPYPGAQYQGGAYTQGQYLGTMFPDQQNPGTSVPPQSAATHDFGNDPEGGKQ